MTDNDILTLISGIIDVPIEDINMETGPYTIPEWDSLAQLTIVAALESEYNISLSMDEILSIKNANDIKNIINKK